MRQKKILYIIPSFPEVSETFIISNIVSTIKNNFNVALVCKKFNGISKSSQKEILINNKILDRVTVYNIIFPKYKRYIKAFKVLMHPTDLYFFLKFAKSKGKIVLEYLFILQFYRQYRNVDSIHIHFAKDLEPILTLKKIGFLKAKIIVTYHGYDAFILPIGDRLKKLNEDYLKCISSVTVNSHYLKQQLINSGFVFKDIYTIPVGVDTKVFAGQSKQFLGEKWNLISVGRLIQLKGHEFGIRVVKLLMERGYDIDYKIVGSGSEEDKLRELVLELSLEENVFFLGSKTQLELKELYGESDLFLMTSTYDNVTYRREALGVVNLEAQAMGLPIVGFDSGGFKETIQSGVTGVLVEDRDVIGMSNAIIDLLKDEKKYKEFSKNALSLARNEFSMEKIGMDYISLY